MALWKKNKNRGEFGKSANRGFTMGEADGIGQLYVGGKAISRDSAGSNEEDGGEAKVEEKSIEVSTEEEIKIVRKTEVKKVSVGIPSMQQRTIQKRVVNTPDYRNPIPAGMILQGDVNFEEKVQLDGQLRGKVSSTTSITIGKNGVIDGTIEVEELIVYGEVSGEISVKGRVVLKEGGEIRGSLKAERLEVATGGLLNCEVDVRGKTGQLKEVATLSEYLNKLIA